jgi:hypothetical protein
MRNISEVCMIVGIYGWHVLFGQILKEYRQ